MHRDLLILNIAIESLADDGQGYGDGGENAEKSPQSTHLQTVD